MLKIDLAWKALRDIDRNYKVFAHVFDPATEAIAAQWDAMPRDNAYPTSRWIENEVVTETLTIPLTDVPRGRLSHCVWGCMNRRGGCRSVGRWESMREISG